MATPEQEAAVRNAIAFAQVNADERLAKLRDAFRTIEMGKVDSELSTVITELKNEVVKKLGDAFPL